MGSWKQAEFADAIDMHSGGEHSSDKILIKTDEEIELMYQANQITAGVLDTLKKSVRYGISTFELDKVAEEYCRDHKVYQPLKVTEGFLLVYAPQSTMR